MRNNIKILIVDDDSRNLRILDEILSELCILDKAIDGEQAIKKATTFAPDLILLDCMMPVKAGLEVCKQLKTDLQYNHIKIIFVTGKAGGAEKSQALEMGADGYLTKPFNEKQLLSILEQVMV